MVQVKRGVLTKFQQDLYDQWKVRSEEILGMSLEEYLYVNTNKENLANQELLSCEEIKKIMESQKYNEVLHDINAFEQMSYLGNKYSFERDVRQHKYSDCDHCYI